MCMCARGTWIRYNAGVRYFKSGGREEGSGAYQTERARGEGKKKELYVGVTGRAPILLESNEGLEHQFPRTIMVCKAISPLLSLGRSHHQLVPATTIGTNSGSTV